MTITNNTGDPWPEENARLFICGEVYNTSAAGVNNEIIQIGFIVNEQEGVFNPDDTTTRVSITNVPSINFNNANPLQNPLSFTFETTAGFQIPDGEFIKIVCRNITTPENVPIFVNLFVVLQDDDL